MDKKKQIRTGGSLSWEEREAMIKEYLTGKLNYGRSTLAKRKNPPKGD